MKITAIETIRLGEFPNLLWVHVESDEGIKGLGEVFFGAGAVDGDAGERTRAAVAAFQAAEGLEVTGEVDDDVLSHLEELHES